MYVSLYFNKIPVLMLYLAATCVGAFLESFFISGALKNQPQQLMFGSGFSEFYIKQEFAVNLYRRLESERFRPQHLG